MFKFYLIAVLCMVMAIHGNEVVNESSPHRELRRGGGGRSSSRSSSRSSYSSSYSKPRTTTMTTTTYRKTTNSYFKNGRTYHAFYVYYLPPNYVSVVGYYSPLYLQIYYNGYGYNFYYGKYGYYQDSSNGGGSGGIVGIIVVILIIACCIGLCCYISAQ